MMTPRARSARRNERYPWRHHGKLRLVDHGVFRKGTDPDPLLDGLPRTRAELSCFSCSNNSTRLPDGSSTRRLFAADTCYDIVLPGDYGAGEPPVPIPNTEVKPCRKRSLNNPPLPAALEVARQRLGAHLSARTATSSLSISPRTGSGGTSSSSSPGSAAARSTRRQRRSCGGPAREWRHAPVRRVGQGGPRKRNLSRSPCPWTRPASSTAPTPCSASRTSRAGAH